MKGYPFKSDPATGNDYWLIVKEYEGKDFDNDFFKRMDALTEALNSHEVNVKRGIRHSYSVTITQTYNNGVWNKEQSIVTNHNAV